MAARFPASTVTDKPAREFLPKMFGEEIVQAFREFKAIWDPEWKMNPGKVVDPYGITENLRLGTSYNPPQSKRISSFRTTRALSRTLRFDVSAWVSAGAKKAARCARATWSRARRQHSTAAGRAYCLK